MGNGDIRLGCLDIRRPVALFGSGMKGKLTNQQNITLHLAHGSVHNTGLIVEDPEIDNLSTQPFNILFPICIFNPHEYEQSLVDTPGDLLLHPNRSPADPLYDRSHYFEVVPQDME